MSRRFVLQLVVLALGAHALSAQTSMQAPAARMKRVAVATRAIPRGTVLTPGDFVVRDSVVHTVSAIPDTTRVVAGWTARRSIAAGELLVEPAVEAPAVVGANAPVQVEWMDRNVTLTVRGVAARAGAVGDRVPVRTETGRRLEATIVAPGRVRID